MLRVSETCPSDPEVPVLHKLLPRDYFEYIEQLREHQDPQTIINIMGGQNIVAPSARSATQSFGRGKSPKKGS